MSKTVSFTYPKWALGESVAYIPLDTLMFGLPDKLFPISMLFVSKETGEDPLTGESVKLVTALCKTEYRQSIMSFEAVTALIEEYNLVPR